MRARISLFTLSVVLSCFSLAFAQAPQTKIPSPQDVQDQEPPDEPCPPGAYREAPHTQCLRSNPSNKLDRVPAPLQPPPGVIVLRPGGVREQADSCPEEFKEVEGENKWRFCIHPGKPEVIPPLWAPPIAGVPYEQALEIHNRHKRN